METKQSLTILGILSTLFICILLITLSFTILYQSSQRYNSAQALLNSLDTYLKKEEQAEETMNLPQTEEEVDADILYDVFYLREANGKIGVFTEQGYLVRMLTVDVAMLPEADRLALSDGICVTSWRELIALIEDYES